MCWIRLGRLSSKPNAAGPPGLSSTTYWPKPVKVACSAQIRPAHGPLLVAQSLLHVRSRASAAASTSGAKTQLSQCHGAGFGFSQKKGTEPLESKSQLVKSVG